MNKTIIANVMPEETRMALLEDGELTEVSVERSESGHIVGNIYKGKVKNVLPGMQAAFIDIGRDKNAFLYVGDLQAGGVPRENLTAGQDLIIQIVKDAIGAKGPRATTHLTLPGRYVVLMPTVDYIGISRRIESEEERERLRQLAEQVKPDGMGIIVRTVAEHRGPEELTKDVEYLLNVWNTMSVRGQRVAAPALLYRDVDLVIRIVRDYLSADVEEFILDNQEAFGRVGDLLQFCSPELLSRVRLFTGGPDREDILTHYGINAEIAKLGDRRVELKSGGYLVIDYTEALTVIDINTGKFVGRTNLADTVLQINLEAAKEIARQLRLRDIGGIIIVDFIDMDREEDQQMVLRVLEEKLKQDRTKTNLVGLTGLGLVEMTRKKARQNLEGTLYSNCPVCEGRGRLQSPETVAIGIKRELRRISSRSRNNGGCLVIEAHPKVVERLQEQGEPEHLMKELARMIRMAPVTTMHPEVFSILWEKEQNR
ncbi:MAG TPA: Rne/Rng family ribonuclease [Patescibacteria group bacterium]|nr:Rne/Rng family ribonuclease [Patescibacteria group bacterium]